MRMGRSRSRLPQTRKVGPSTLVRAAFSFCQYNGHMREIFSHHAVCIEGEPKEMLAMVKNSLGDAKIEVAGNPDVFIADFETFGIDEVRDIINRAGERGFTPSGKWFIVSFLSATREAQNALLKTIEEPSPETHFVFITPDTSRILATLRSRMRMIRTESAESLKEAEDFLKNPIPARLAFISSIIKDKDRARGISFLRNLERAAGKKGLASKDPEFVHDLLRLRDYLADRGSSVKIILEYIAHVAPRI